MSDVATRDDLARRIEHCQRLLAAAERELIARRRDSFIRKILSFDSQEITLVALINALADRN